MASLTREQDVWEHYHVSVAAQTRRSLISVAKSSTLYAFSQSAMFLCIALGFWYGGTLIGKGEYTMFQFFLCFSAVIFGAQSAGTGTYSVSIWLTIMFLTVLSYSLLIRTGYG